MKKILLALTTLIVSCSLAFAQEHTISGTVTGPDGSGIPGITVQIKGTNAGTATDVDGHYSLPVPENATLVFRGIGYGEQEVAVGSQTTINVTMSSSLQSLSEVVVVGYSTTTKQAFTGSVKTVSADRIANKDVSDVSQALAGEVPGVRVINTSGQPGSAPTIRIRGFGSVNGNRDPLYVVDGIPYTGYTNSLNPEDIKSINVLTDAVATAIYGARGSNGVILITTKDGKGEKPFVEVDMKYGVNKRILPGYDVIRSPETYMGLVWEGLYNANQFYTSATGYPLDPTGYANKFLFSGRGIAPGYNIWQVPSDSAGVAQLIDPSTHMVKGGIQRKYTPLNWADYAFQPANRTETNLKLGGGDEKTSYYTSIGYLDANGYSIKSDFQRITARLNLEHNVNSWLSGNMNFSYANTTTNNNGQEENSNSVFWFTDNIPPIYPLFLRDENGQRVEDPIFGGFQYDYGGGEGKERAFGALTNAIADAHYNTYKSKRNDFNGNGSLKVKFLKHFDFKSQFGLQYYNRDYVNLTNKFYGSAASQNGSIYVTKTEMLNYDWLNILHYNQTFGHHNVEALAAHEATSWKTHYLSAFKSNLVRNDNTELDNAVVSSPTSSYTEAYDLESWFAQVNYDYKSTYYLSGSIRRDGSSRFVKNKWGTFGSVGAGWLVSNENFMHSAGIIKYLKLKASYGLIGDQEGVGFYPGYDVSTVSNVNDQPSISFSEKGNPDLTWETSKILQFGTEFKVGTFLTGSVDYYIKNTDNLIFEFRPGPSIGYAIIRVNDGRLRNQGLEFDLTGHLLNKKDFYIDLGINGEVMKNEITRMPIDPSSGKPRAIDPQGVYGWSEGHSVYDFYIHEYRGVDPEDGASTWTAYYDDANGNDQMDLGESIPDLIDYKSKNPDKAGQIKTTTTKVYTQATDFYVGKSAVPKVRGGINLTAGYKGFDLAVQMLYSLGGYGYDGLYADIMDDISAGGNNWSTDILKRWQKKGDITNVPRLTNGQDTRVASASTRFLTKADYLMLNNVRLGYTFPEAWVGRYGIENLTIWVSGDNLWLQSSRKGFNPITTEYSGTDRYLYPPLSTLSAGIKIRF